MVSKLFFYVHDFDVSYDSFVEEWKSFALPVPCNCSLEEAYRGMSESCKFCIQDEKCKYIMDTNIGKFSSVSIMMNFALRSLDKEIGVFRKLSEPTCRNMSDFLQKQSDVLIMLNAWMFSFQLYSTDDEELTSARTKMFYPNENYWNFSRDIKNIINTYCILYEEGYEKYDRIKQCSLYSSVLLHNMMISFNMLCALFLDSTCASLKYGVSFVNMWMYIQYKYHNCYLYRVEMPLSPLNTSKRTDQRGAKDYTTRMKIYLFDNNLTPILIRLDLPHSGLNCLHANISTFHGKKINGEDHKEFKSDCSPEDLNSLFESMYESIKEQTPHLFKIVDTTSKEENIIFSEMQKFLVYDSLCMNILRKQPYDTELKKIGGFLCKKNIEPLENILLEAYTKFKQ